MDVENLDRVRPFITKDGSQIRELLAHRNSCILNQSLAEARVPQGATTLLHYHCRAEEIYYVVSGKGRMRLGEETREIGPGDAVAIPPGEVHQVTNTGAGELVFLIGGNGSGKTTLAKLLVGLYVPEAGEIRWHGQSITDDNRESYRQHFSAVFSDFYLFDSLLGLDTVKLDTRARDYLVQLQLNHKVQVEDGRLSTLDLSQGQRKRLALLTAYLEDRSFYVFDEWAADQDPLFKQFFYLQLLPELQARDKTVLVITHDDQYFHMADRCLKLEEGKFQGAVL